MHSEGKGQERLGGQMGKTISTHQILRLPHLRIDEANRFCNSKLGAFVIVQLKVRFGGGLKVREILRDITGVFCIQKKKAFCAPYLKEDLVN